MDYGKPTEQITYVRYEEPGFDKEQPEEIFEPSAEDEELEESEEPLSESGSCYTDESGESREASCGSAFTEEEEDESPDRTSEFMTCPAEYSLGEMQEDEDDFFDENIKPFTEPGDEDYPAGRDSDVDGANGDAEQTKKAPETERLNVGSIVYDQQVQDILCEEDEEEEFESHMYIGATSAATGTTYYNLPVDVDKEDLPEGFSNNDDSKEQGSKAFSRIV